MSKVFPVLMECCHRLVISGSSSGCVTLVSSYPSTLLQKYIKTNKWQLWSVEKGVSINAKSGYLKRKVECLTSNYEL